MKDNIRSIIIIYDWNQTKNAIELLGFFRMLGVIVEEYRVIEQESSKAVDFKDFDVVLNMSSKMSIVEGIEDIQVIKLCPETVGDIYSYVLNALKEISTLSEKTIEIWKEIAGIYKTNKIALNDYNTEYYFFDKDIAEKSYVAFLEANAALITLASDAVGLQKNYVNYSRGYCIRRMHELAKELHCAKVYDVSKLLQALDEILETDPKFISCYLLKAYLADTDEELYFNSIVYYEKFLSLNNNNEKMYSYKVYYRIGRRYEKIHSNLEKANEYYKKAVDLKNDDYKSLYKVAMYYRMTKNYDDAKRVFLQIITILDKAKKEKYTQPVEYLYMYKVKFILGKICTNENQRAEAISYYEEADSLLKQTVNDSFFYQDLYGAEAEFYFEKVRNRIPTDSAKLNQEYLEIISGK